MGLFSGGKNVLGIDLGSTSIKVVELKRTKPLPTLVTYGYLERATGDITRGNQEEVQKMTAESLKKLCQQAGVTTDSVVTALPNFSVFSSIITLPIISNKELKEAIIAKAKKIIPLPFEDVILDWKILGKFIPANNKETTEGEKKEKKTKENYKILINVASKNLVKRYLEIFKAAGLKLLSLETESFALVRALIGNDPSIVMIIDFSAVSTDIIIVEKMIPIFNRSIDIGGVTITRAIAQSLNIDFQKAEQFKKDLEITKEIKYPPPIEGTLKSLTEEIKYSIELFKNQTNKNIEKIILSGGSAYLPKLDEYFSREINMKFIISNPWKRISYPAEIEPALTQVAPRFSVAIGLALR